MKFQIIPVTPFQQNCTLMWDETTNKAAVVDPGGDIDKISEALKQRNLTLEKVFVTHGHLDHCGGARKLVAELKKRGIHNASIAGRGKITQGIAFQVNNPDDHQLDRINDLLDAYPQITRKSCQQPGEVVQ